MKIWLKYFLGCTLGVLMAVFLPFDFDPVQKILEFCTEFSVRFGRYMLIPLIFFGTAVAVCKLRASGRLPKTILKTAGIVVASSFMLTLLGLISVLIVKLPRIPISVEKISQPLSLNTADNILAIFPYSVFEIFTDGAFLLPVFISAGFIGAACCSDRLAAKPVFTLFESFSRIIWTISNLFIDIFSIGLIAVSCSWTIQFIDVLQTGVFNRLIILLFADLLIIAFVLYPAIMRFTFREMHPYRILYASAASVFTAFFTGDSNMTLVVNLFHAKGSLGIKRKINAAVLPIFSVFARGGAAFVTAISFILILRSYSSLGISIYDICWICLVSFAVSFVLGALPSGGPFIALTVICSLYGRGFDSGYLLLKPIAPVLCSFAAAIDAVTAMFGSYLIAWKSGQTEHIELKRFI